MVKERVRIRLRDITLELDEEVYKPSDDSILMLDALDTLPPLNDMTCLDVGTGSGVLAIKMAKMGCKTTGSDISLRSLMLASRNAIINGVSIEFVQGNLTHHFRDKSFNIVVFNPPYIPEEPKRDIELSIAWAGGIDGRRLIDGLITDLPRILKEKGISLILHASYNLPHKTIINASELGMVGKIIMRRKLAFHELLVVEVRNERAEHL